MKRFDAIFSERYREMTMADYALRDQYLQDHPGAILSPLSPAHIRSIDQPRTLDLRKND